MCVDIAIIHLLCRKRGEDSLNDWIKYQNNIHTLQEYGVNIDERDPRVMFDNLEKSLQLISKPGLKIIPIPRIG